MFSFFLMTQLIDKKRSKNVTFTADHCNILCSQMIITNFTTIFGGLGNYSCVQIQDRNLHLQASISVLRGLSISSLQRDMPH